jgi:pantoate--beta-alanine ligase
MKVFTDLSSARMAVKSIKHANQTIGLVPTMGALHYGHLSLVSAAKKDNDITIVTIYVNPLQFNNKDDLKNYPSSIEKDISLLKQHDCDILFIPANDIMYPTDPVTRLSFGALEDSMEGKFRPGHFGGVALVVLKLFHLLQPTIAYFGQKDLQQFKIIEKMVFDTSMDIQLKMMPIIREKSGLALSSRNRRLDARGKIIAPEIFRALKITVDAIKKGDSVKSSIDAALNYLVQYPDIKIEYLTLVNLKDLMAVETTNGFDQLVLCFAGFIGEIRLIDNIIINKKEREGNAN